jgi:xanthine dehydrogenase YagT iron-sulfur-binding subunit
MPRSRAVALHPCMSESAKITPPSVVPPVTRRVFLKNVGFTGLAVTVPQLFGEIARTPTSVSEAVPDRFPATKMRLVLSVNGQARTLEIEPRAVLLDVLRDDLHLPGTKKGCDHGQCGACTVLISGRRVNSCLTLAAMHGGSEITTIEGLERDGNLHPMQAAFMECDAFQCGACTSGQIMSAVGLMAEPIGRSDAAIRESMSGNICRCGAYKNIIAAVRQVRAATAG